MKTAPIITVEQISKQYHLGRRSAQLSLVDGIDQLKRLPRVLFSSPTKKPRTFWALQDVTFKVKPGEVVGIIGRNGSGKSTLLKILSRITGPTSGEARIQGRVASLLEVGTGFNAELTGRENIFLNGSILGMTRREIRKKFDEIVAFSGVERFLDTPVKRYSSGMYVRLAFAVAAHLESEILLIDEILAVGDAEFQKKCLGKMDAITKQEDRTILFVSHNLGAISNLCPRSLFLNRGKLIADGPTTQVLSTYDQFVKQQTVNQAQGFDTQAHRDRKGGLEITRIVVCTKSGKPVQHFAMGKTIQFKASFKVTAPLSSLVLFIALRSAVYREAITSIRKKVDHLSLKPGDQGCLTVTLVKPMLRPGSYPLYFYLRDHEYSEENYDILDDLTPPLVIVANLQKPSLDFIPNRDVGYVSVQAKMELDLAS